jgi:hypothetical protein
LTNSGKISYNGFPLICAVHLEVFENNFSKETSKKETKLKLCTKIFFWQFTFLAFGFLAYYALCAKNFFRWDQSTIGKISESTIKSEFTTCTQGNAWRGSRKYSKIKFSGWRVVSGHCVRSFPDLRFLLRTFSRPSASRAPGPRASRDSSAATAAFANRRRQERGRSRGFR